MRVNAAVSLLALLLGAAFSVWLLSWHGIWPPAPLDVAQVGDGAQSVVGQRYFLAAPWSWQLLVAPALAAPAGTNIALTDSVPLAMLLLKPWRAWLPPGFFLQSGWLFVVWTLQPVAAVYALRGTGERRVLPALAAAVLSLNMPVLLIRAGHVALSSQCTLLVALGAYLRLTAGARRRDWVVATALPGACLLIHPYILALVMGILSAVLLTLLLRGQPWRGAAAWLAAVVAGLFGCAVLLGFTGTQTVPGFGYYSLNLLGPFLPQHSLLFGNWGIDATGGQAHEGMVWPGAGLWLLALVMAVQAVRGGWPLGWRRHAGLLAVLAGMALFALSNKVYAGRLLVLALGEPPGVVEQFRATGRFFWPVLYTLLVSGVACAARSLPRRPAYAVLLAACALQVADVTPLRADLWRGAHPPALPWSIDRAALQPIFAAHARLVLWPIAGCGLHAESAPAMQVLLLASQTVMPTNTTYGGRPTAAAVCDAGTVLGTPLLPGELRVVLQPRDAWLVPGAADLCRRSGVLTLCATDAQRWTGLAPLSEPKLETGLAAIAAEGWSDPGPDGAIWSDGPGPALRFTSRGGELAIDAVGFAPRAGGTQHVSAWIGGERAGQWDMPDLAPCTLRLQVPPGAVTIQFRVAQPSRPLDRGMNDDPRRLGLQLRAVRLSD